MRKLLVKINDGRVEAYRTVTTVFEDEAGGRWVRKSPLTREAAPHVADMARSAEALSRLFPHVQVCPCTVDGEDVVFPFVQGTSVLSRMLEAAGADREAYIALWKHFFAALEPQARAVEPFAPGAAFERMFGEGSGFEGAPAVRGCAFDLTPSNMLMRDDGGCTLIDYEWHFEEPVPLALLFYHAAATTYRFYDQLQIVPLDEILALAGIGEIRGACEQAMAHFYAHLFDDTAQVMQRYAKPVLDVPRLQAEREYAQRLNAEMKGELQALKAAHDGAVEQWTRAAQRLEEKEGELAAVCREREELLGSTSWRMTRPLRAAGRMLRRIRGGEERQAGTQAAPAAVEERKLPAACLDSSTCDRLGIYFFYDGAGVVDRYVPRFLEDLSRNLTELVIVCNGTLTQEGRQTLSRFTPHVLVRENEGLDVYAFQAGLRFFGWDRLRQADEVVLCNSTIMGPLHPLSETFEKMAGKALDFWGLTCYYEGEADPFHNPYGYTPTHLQSHFIVYRKSFLQSDSLRAFWEHPPCIRGYADSVGLYESWFTRHFADLGYTWAASVETDDLQSMTDYPLMYCARELIERRGCPIFKRRTFFQDYDHPAELTLGNAAVELYDYIDQKTDYDIDILWETLLRSYHQSDLVNNLHLNYILPEHAADTQAAERLAKAHRLCLVMHLFFPDLIEQSFEYACNMPEGTDVYITTNTEEKRGKILSCFEKRAWGKLDVRVIENRGRDVSALLTGVKDVIMDYDLCCFVHDKKTAQVRPGTVGEGFAQKCFGNTLGSRALCRGIVALFDSHPRLGIALPPVPFHGGMYMTLGNEWTCNFENTEKLARQLGITVPMSPDKPPVAPLGTMFWFRPKALVPLYARDWQYEDFPPEPNDLDGTLLHAIERVYPFAAQQAGYYPAYIMSEKLAATELVNLRFHLAGLNHILYEQGFGGGPWQVKQSLQNLLVTGRMDGKVKARRFINRIRPHIPRRLWRRAKEVYFALRRKKC